MDNLFNLGITTGDPDGVGLEITLKALSELNLESNVVVWKSKDTRLPSDLPFSFTEQDSFKEISFQKKSPEIHFVNSKNLAPLWVKEVCDYSKEGALQGLITGPLSKPLFHEACLDVMGHTGLLKNEFQTEDLFMGFIGPKMSLSLITDHIPLRDVENVLTMEKIESHFHVLEKYLESLDKKRFHVALLGLNPHAGEKGLIGSFEKEKVEPFLKKYQGPMDIDVLPADTAFSEEHLKFYDHYVAFYHDQGLIPFKLMHGFSSGAQLSLGIPLVRTSVDHGTAKELVGKKRADHGSMKYAIGLCEQIVRSQYASSKDL